MTPPPNRSLTRIRYLLRDRQRGAAAVEFALIAPLFFMIAFATFTGAYAFNQRNQITHAAREGARYGATVPVDAFGTGGEWADNVAQHTRDSAYGDLATGAGIDGSVCVALVEGNGQAPSFPSVVDEGNGSFQHAEAGCGSPFPFHDGITGDDRRVQVSVTRSGYINAILFRMDLTLPSQAVTRHEEPLD